MKALSAMLTLRFWLAFSQPPASHPIFHYIVRRHAPRRRSVIGLIVLFLLFCFSLALAWPSLIRFFYLGPAILVVFLPLLLSTIYGLTLANAIGNALAHWRDSGLHDYFGVVPPGRLWAIWTLSLGRLYRNRVFQGLRFMLSFLFGVIFIAVIFELILLLLVLASTTRPEFQGSWIELFLLLMNLLLLATALIGEFIQSGVLGSLMGMILPAYTGNRINILLLTPGLFLMMQVMTYIVVFAICFVALPQVFQIVGWRGEIADMGLSVLRVAVFFATREIFIALIWHLLTRQLHGHALALNQLPER